MVGMAKALVILGTLVSPAQPGTTINLGTKAPEPTISVPTDGPGPAGDFQSGKDASGPEIAPVQGAKPADQPANPETLTVSADPTPDSTDLGKAAEDQTNHLELKVLKVNSKRISLNYEVKDVGQSGISDVELWYTQDGRTWQKHGGPPSAPPRMWLRWTRKTCTASPWWARTASG